METKFKLEKTQERVAKAAKFSQDYWGVDFSYDLFFKLCEYLEVPEIFGWRKIVEYRTPMPDWFVQADWLRRIINI